MTKQGNTNLPSSRFIDTFTVVPLGCAKNQVDAEELIVRLEAGGYVYSPEPDNADLIIINTCGFIRAAKEESIRETVEMRERFPDRKIVLAGCFSQRYGASLLEKLPEIDGVFGNRDLSRIGSFVSSLAAAGNHLDGVTDQIDGSPLCPAPDVKTAQTAPAAQVVPTAPAEGPSRSRLLGFPGSVYVKIAEGCDNRCSYCAIPLIRGDLRSRELKSVVKEIDDFIDRGVFEIVLIAQDLSSYGVDRGGNSLLLPLLEEVSALPGNFWIRLLYIHPDHFPFEILDLCANDRRILPYFDLPFQHASAGLLSRMNRRGNRETYLTLVDTIRGALPDAVIRSTFLLGFPGENGKAFRELRGFIEEARVDWGGFFTYSREEGTPAYRFRGGLGDVLSRGPARRRMEELREIQERITRERMDRFVGHTMDVLIEEEIPGEGVCLGRGYIHAPEVDGAVVVKGAFAPGTVVSCVITARNGIDLEASPTDIFPDTGRI